jgi:hypothetical protein
MTMMKLSSLAVGIAQVIAAVQAAFDTPSTIESTENTLAINNELGCPLN